MLRLYITPTWHSYQCDRMAFLLYVILILLSYGPIACAASWVCGGRQKGARHVLENSTQKNANRRFSSEIVCATTGRTTGFVPGGGHGRDLTASRGQWGSHARRGGVRRGHSSKPRAMPPLDNRSDKGGGASGPLGAVNPDAIYTANEWIAGLAGGSVGVMGTLIQLELKQENLRRRRNCPYCNGSGKLVCAQCCCSGKFVTKLPGSESNTVLPCPGCAGSKYIECLNCRGDGRAVPRELDRKTADAAEVDLRLEEIGMSQLSR